MEKHELKKKKKPCGNLVVMRLLLMVVFVMGAKIAQAQYVKPGDVIYESNGTTPRGVVFWVAPDGISGWMVALNDASTGVKWNSGGTAIPDMSLTTAPTANVAITDTSGHANTAKLRTYPTAGAALAISATDFAAGWQLPAAGQLRKLYSVLPEVNPALAVLGGSAIAIAAERYWSSTQSSSAFAWSVGFNDGSVLQSGVFNAIFRVRAVCAFNLFNPSTLLPAGLAVENGALARNTIASLNKDSVGQAANYNGPALGTDSYAGDDAGFVSATDFYLTATSDLRGKGNVSYVPSGLTKDLDGNPRIMAGRVDPGAYQSKAVTSLTLTDKTVTHDGQRHGVDSVFVQENGQDVGEKNWVTYKYFLNGVEQTGLPVDMGAYKAVACFAGNDTLGACQSDSAGLVITAPGAPVITSQPRGAVRCAGSDYTFTVTATGSQLTYQWYFNGQAIVGAINMPLSLNNLSPGNAGSYTVEVSNPGGSVMSGAAHLWVAEKIPQPILFEVSDVVYQGQPTRLHVGYADGYNDVTNYTWSFGEPNTGTYAPDQHTVFVTFNTVADSQRVSLKMEHVCGSYEVYKDIKVESPTGMEELTLKSLKLFPNPFQNEVYIHGAEDCMLRIVSAYGVVVHTEKLKNAEETVLTGHLPEGVYLFRLEKDGKVKTVKGVKN